MRRKGDKNVTIEAITVASKQSVLFDVPLNELKGILRKAVKEKSNLVEFKVGKEKVRLETNIIREVIKIAEIQFKRELLIPNKLQKYLTIFSDPKFEKITERQEEIDRLFTCLCSKKKSNIMLIGEHGVGKTTIAKEVVRQIETKKIKALSEYSVIEINALELLNLGDRSEKKYIRTINSIIKYVILNSDKVIFYIDDLKYFKYDSFLYKLFLILIRNNNVKLISSVCTDDFNNYFVNDSATMKYFNPIVIEEPEINEIYPMLKKQIANLQKIYNINISEKMIRFAILTGFDLSSSNSANPESTLDIINFALSDANRKGQKEVEKHNILSYYYIDFKLANKTSEHEKWITAYHEAGHYLVSKMSKNIKNMKNAFVSILPIEGALGLTVSYMDFSQQLTFSKEYYIDQIAYSLGGRVGETSYTNEFSSGAQADLTSANSMAEQLVLSYGLTEIDGEKNKSYMVGNYIKEFLLTDELRIKINKEISNIINESYSRAEEIIKNNKALLDEIAIRLVEEGALMGDELEEIYNKFEA